ncbi:MAG: hypothetical protein F4X19_14155 [Acidobacteria bacterium]|nr:hypothetical protein [Acidobacteriota bacterium]
MASPGVRIGLDEAEAVASTLASLESFRACCTKPSSRCSLAYLNWRFRELGIQKSAELQLKQAEEQGEHIDVFLRRHAGRYLEPYGDTAGLKPNHRHPGEEILRWRWMSLALPVDLMLAAADYGNTRRVRVLDPSLRVLESTAHLHFHATAAIPFAHIWTALGERAVFDKIKEPPEGFANSREWRAWLRRALIARRALDFWLRYGFEKLERILRDRPQISHALGDMRFGRIRGYSQFVESSLTGYLRLPRFYFGLGHERYGLGDNPRRDILGEELHFNRRCLRFLASTKGTFENSLECVRIFRQIWAQMTRIRVMLYRHLVHDPARSGLDEFARRFKRLNEYMVLTDSVREEVAAATEPESGLTIESLELRKKPGGISKLKRMHHLSKQLSSDAVGKRPRMNRKALPRAPCRQRSDPRLTWTLHFIRDSGRKAGIKEQIRSHHVTARKLVAAIRFRPELLQSIRGLDVASRELSGPLWAVAPQLQFVREESVGVCAGSRCLEPFRVTVHAGEDFRHLLSGLRAIHEPFWWELMRRGDRIGHALALGWDPQEWCACHPEVVQPRLERMFDLAWMLDFVQTRRLQQVAGAALHSADGELHGHLQSWNKDYGVREFVEVVRKIGKPWLWNFLDGPHWPHRLPTGKYWRLLREILSRQGKRDDTVPVRTEGDEDLLAILRDELAKLLSKWRTPIEINPSSNLLIGDLPYPLAQPLFCLDPFDRKESRGLVLTLSADDPVCFATGLADEFAYAWAGLVIGGGESPTYAQEWLERAARAARRAAF